MGEWDSLGRMEGDGRKKYDEYQLSMRREKNYKWKEREREESGRND